MRALRCGAARLAGLMLTAPVHGQGVRGTAVTTARYIEMRPITQDTVSRERVTELPDGTLVFEGHTVTCISTLPCVYYRSLAEENAVVATQDVSLTAWGLGVQGLSMTALLRARGDVGGDFLWPRSTDHFDAILAYAELNRSSWRARLGRQRTTAGLGFSGYDGANLVVSPFAWLDLEGYAGRSLARGLNDTRAEALQGIEDFVFDRDAWLLGAAARATLPDGTSFAARYQRDIWTNRSGLLSERMSVEAASQALGPVSLDGGVDYDFAFRRIGKAHLTARAQHAGRIMLEASARRYLPYFELWTIWGFFSPVAYHEAEARATWRPTDRVSAFASAGWRRYEEANATVILRPIERAGVRGMIGGGWQPLDQFRFDATYRLERGFGAFLSSADLSMDWRPADRVAVGVEATAFQQIEQFRVGEGIVYGGGPSLDLQLRPSLSLNAGVTMYRQTFDNRPGVADWNQLRAWTMLRAGFGRDPGRARGAS